MFEVSPTFAIGAAFGLRGIFSLDNPSTVNQVIDDIQAQLAPLAAKLPSGLTVAGPNLVPGPSIGLAPVLRIGIWFLPTTFAGFATPDPSHPHRFPLLTPGSAEQGFAAVPPLGLTHPPDGIGASFGMHFATSTLNVIAQSEIPAIQARLPAPLVLNALTVSCAPRGVITTSFQGDAGFPIGGFAGSITEVLGRTTDPKTMMNIPAIKDHSSSVGTDAGNQVLIGLAVFLAAGSIFGAAFVPSIVINAYATSKVNELADKVTSVATGFVNILPPSFPFEMPNLNLDFPALIFNWPKCGTTDSGSGIIATATVKVDTRKASPAMTLTGLSHFDGSQTDMAGGFAADYTVAWSDIAPNQVIDKLTGSNTDAQGFGWQSSDDPRAPLTASFPFNTTVTADFALPDPVAPGQYRFTVSASALETCGNDPKKTLSASANLDILVVVTKDPPGPVR